MQITTTNLPPVLMETTCSRFEDPSQSKQLTWPQGQEHGRLARAPYSAINGP